MQWPLISKEKMLWQENNIITRNNIAVNMFYLL